MLQDPTELDEHQREPLPVDEEDDEPTLKSAVPPYLLELLREPDPEVDVCRWYEGPDHG